MITGSKRSHHARTDVLLVNPPSPDGFIYIRDINRHGRSSWERIIWPQTSLAYLAAVAAKQGLSVDIVDCIAESISWKRYEQILHAMRPRYCLGNVISVTYSNDVKALRRAKDISGAVTIAMGPHMTDAPERSLREAEGIDFVIRHEAEETLRELLEVHEKCSEPTVEQLARIDGIAFMPGRLKATAAGRCVVTSQRPFIPNLDSLPWPRHDLLPLDRYWAPFLGRYTFVEASRGCAFRCIFCRQAVMWQWKFRRRSGHEIAREALYVHSLGVDNILFHADTFTLDPTLVDELCDTLIAAGAPLRWACNAHVKTLLDRTDMVHKMKEAGCWMIAVGVESGDDEILATIRKQITVAEARSAIQTIAAAGIEAWGYFVLGFPGETRETMQKTIDLACSLPLKMAKFDIAAPYPGTEFHRYCRKQGYLRVNRYEDYDQNASAVVEYPQLSRAEIKAAVRRGTRRFFLRPAMVRRILREGLRPRSPATVAMILCDYIRLLAGGRRKRSDGETGCSDDIECDTGTRC